MPRSSHVCFSIYFIYPFRHLLIPVCTLEKYFQMLAPPFSFFLFIFLAKVPSFSCMGALPPLLYVARSKSGHCCKCPKALCCMSKRSIKAGSKICIQALGKRNRDE